MNTPARSRSLASAARTPLVVAGLLAALVLGISSSARAQTSSPSTVCSAVASGAAWSYKGQKGTVYSVLGVNGASCAVGIKFVPHWTRERGAYDLKPVPAGWHCSAIGSYTAPAKLGQCTTSKGGILEWLPKLKR